MRKGLGLRPVRLMRVLRMSSRFRCWLISETLPSPGSREHVRRDAIMTRTSACSFVECAAWILRSTCPLAPSVPSTCLVRRTCTGVRARSARLLCAGVGYPELLSKCPTKVSEKGPFDPTVNTTMVLMKMLLRELSELFPDKNLHIGGDEVRTRH